MMTPFLRQVADHYYNSGDISRRCFVFPNRRSMVFFRKWLSARIAEEGAKGNAKPIVAPEMLTVSEFFQKVSGLTAADRVELLLELHKCYKEINPKGEELDEFIFWGDVILADFNDVDKYLVNPKQLFANIADFKAIQDTFSYLSETQRKAIETFVLHFGDLNGKLTVDLESQNPNIKERFLQIWNRLQELYELYNRSLREKGLAYDGMTYRSIADSLAEKSVDEVLEGTFPSDVKFVFVGLNALNECEKALLRRLRDCGRAEFCWDWCGDMIRDSKNRASFFMADNYKEFPPAFELSSEGVGKAEFNSLSVPSSYGQVKHLQSILNKVGYEDKGGKDSSDTAIVLPDETLLMPLLNSIPEEIKNINVTMGYPMTAGELYILMRDIARMQLYLRNKHNGWHYYHKQVWDIISSGIFRRLMDAAGLEECKERIASIKKNGKYYIPQDDLAGNPLMNVIFRPVVSDLTAKDASQVQNLASYLQDVVSYIAPLLASDPEMALEVEFAKKYYSSINSLKSRDLAILPATFIRLIESMMAGTAIPFKGEPLKGLQIMGPLETRALDFRNVVIMSCNEGMFPRRNVSSSFIPPELRKAFHLPTYEFQDAIWAYYFYRLVSRAENVWMVYDSRTEGLKRGEESRYIKQLRYHFGINVKTHVAGAGLASCTDTDTVMEKSDEMMERINTMTYSASALQNYVACPMKFCYSSVLQLKKDEDVAESMSSSMIGNVYHNTMWALYYGEEAMRSDGAFDKLEKKPDVGMKRVTVKYLKSWKNREDEVSAKVASLMKAELKTDEISGRDLIVHKVIVRYVMETIEKEIAFLGENPDAGFDIIGLERPVNADIHGAKFFGVVDRIDSHTPGGIRVVDYKSGSDDPKVIDIDDARAEIAVEKIFSGKYKENKANKAALQFYIYDRMVQDTGLAKGMFIFNTMYATSDLFRNTPSSVPLSSRFAELMDLKLKELLDEIRDKGKPFVRTDDEDACKYCDFKMICGR